MSISDWCGNCKELILLSHPHKCKPRFEVRCEEEGYEWRPVFASDFDYAAEEWAERYDSEDCDYFLAKGSTLVVEVKDSNEVIKKFEVSGEVTTRYSAREV